MLVTGQAYDSPEIFAGGLQPGQNPALLISCEYGSVPDNALTSAGQVQG
jgi:hypothetical protein